MDTDSYHPQPSFDPRPPEPLVPVPSPPPVTNTQARRSLRSRDKLKVPARFKDFEM